MRRSRAKRRIPLIRRIQAADRGESSGSGSSGSGSAERGSLTMREKRGQRVALLSKTATDVYICRCLRPTGFQLVTNTISLLASNTKDFGSPDLWLVSNPTKAVQQAK